MFPGSSRRALSVVTLTVLVAAPLGCDSPVRPDAKGKAKQEVPDFNGDGYADLAVRIRH